jgi:hypothetical protein
MEGLPEETTFQGKKIIEGKEHYIRSTTCNLCGEILAEMHYGCCGHMASGFSQGFSPHICKEVCSKVK